MQLDVTFPALACSVVSLDAMDISGEQHLDVVSIVFHLQKLICYSSDDITYYWCRILVWPMPVTVHVQFYCV